MKVIFKLSLLFISQVTMAQEAVYEFQGVFGECYPHYSSRFDSLNLYSKPNIDSKKQTISYGVNWEIPYKGGVTRVIKLGTLIAKQEYKLAYCTPALKEDEQKIIVGEEVKYTYYTGEGYGKVLYKGSHCSAPVDEGFDIFETITYPKVQVWIKVLYKDGSSPGWLLKDGSQEKFVRIEC